MLRDREFRLAIVRLARNPRQSDLFVRLNTYSQVLRVLCSATTEQMRVINGPEHVAIVASLRGGGEADHSPAFGQWPGPRAGASGGRRWRPPPPPPAQLEPIRT